MTAAASWIFSIQGTEMGEAARRMDDSTIFLYPSIRQEGLTISLATLRRTPHVAILPSLPPIRTCQDREAEEGTNIHPFWEHTILTSIR